MAEAKGKKFVLNGVGEAVMTRIVDGKYETITLGTLQDMKLSFSASEEDVFGGDSPVPIYIIPKEQKVNVSFTEAQFNLDYLGVTNGAKLSKGGELIFSVEPKLVSGQTYTIEGKTTIIPKTVRVTVSDDLAGAINAQSLKLKLDGEPATGEFTITNAGAVKFGDTLDNKYVAISGMYTSTDARTATVTTASVPQYVELRHVSHPVEMGDGTKVRIHTVIYKARATGKLDIDHKRQAAHAPQLEFSVVYDTTRTDGAIMQMAQEIIAV